MAEPQMELSTMTPGVLRADIESWKNCLGDDDVESYLQRVNAHYDSLAGRVAAVELVELRLMRSLWAKQVSLGLLDQAARRVRRLSDLCQLLSRLSMLRTLIHVAGANRLESLQASYGNRASGLQLARLLAEYGNPAIDTKLIARLDPSGKSLVRRGPGALTRIRPSRGSSRSDPIHWLQDPRMSQVEWIDGNPDHVRVRGIELRSGDIGIVELHHPGDGIFDSFLQQPGLAPHAMLYVSRRVGGAAMRDPLIQPTLIEVYEGGWRSVPLTTGLGPKFSWYSEWVRPTALPDDIGLWLSRQLDTMEPLAFDFQSRRIPRGGRFTADWGQPSASCTNLIRIPFERAGIELPYPTTEIDPGAMRNLKLLGLESLGPIHTPTNILNDSGFAKVGIVDNGCPELAYAQSLVVGRPQLSHTFGGHFCQRPLVLENLPDWKSIRRWKSAREAMLVKLGQSQTWFAELSRFAAGYTASEIPRTASPTTIAFYLRSDMEAGHLVTQHVHARLVEWFADGGSTRLSDLQTETGLCELIQQGLQRSALTTESWYAPPVTLSCN